MLWAIDVGNTHTVLALHNGKEWAAHWRITTHALGTEDEIADRLYSLCQLNGLDLQASQVVGASVNPLVDSDIERFVREYLKCEITWMRAADAKIPILYRPPEAVGADRIANAVGAMAFCKPPFVVVDFGTATTFDVIDATGAYAGGAILPGPDTLMSALTTRTAKLPSVPLKVPDTAIGATTAGALQSGVVLGYAGAIDRILDGILAELGENATVITTGGLGQVIAELCPRLNRYEPMLTLDGLRLFLLGSR